MGQAISDDELEILHKEIKEATRVFTVRMLQLLEPFYRPRTSDYIVPNDPKLFRAIRAMDNLLTNAEYPYDYMLDMPDGARGVKAFSILERID